MRSNPIPVIAAIILLPFTALAQTGISFTLQLRSGSFTPTANITDDLLREADKSAARFDGKRSAILQFYSIPTEKQRAELKLSGIELIDYVPNNAYTVIVSGRPDASLLSAFNARALFDLEPYQKVDPQLANKLVGAGKVRISFSRAFTLKDVVKVLSNKNFTIESDELKDYDILTLFIPYRRLEELASLPFVEFIEKAPGPPQLLATGWTQFGRDGIRTTLLNMPTSVGGKNLNGEGVVIGIGDDSDPQPHPDFSGRLISRSWQAWNFHGTHVAGIAGGAGIINEVRKGSAPKSTLIAQTFSDILTSAPTYVNDYGMVISNNSYGIIENDCKTFGVYTLNSRILDQQAFELPSLQTVFAAGNSGKFKCSPFDSSWHTVLGDYQSAKNVISVGNATATGVILAASSRGPVRDGRIKPEILAIGTAVTSTVFQFLWNYYADNTGTSMSAPAISGGLALLYEKYRLMHSGANPRNGLMKALVCNSGDDWGNAGPDYIHGFGVANFWRAEQMLEHNNYVVDSIATGPDKTTTITLPSGLADLKVMLYWNDPAASAVSSQTLVNDLDLVVEPPSGPSVLPLVLDTAAAQLNNIAHNGEDHINNIEQVVIHSPVAGTYTIRVKATNITQGSPQVFFIVYDTIPVHTKLITPMGKEAYVHGDSVIVQWDSYGDPTGTFDLDLSLDNGTTWSPVKTNIPSNKRLYYFNNPNDWWVVPQVTTDEARMRITRNGTGISDISEKFVIHDTIAVSLSAVQCEGYISIDWNAVTGATGYEVMMLRGSEMVSVATVGSATFTYTIGGLSPDTTYWVTVRPLISPGGSPGRRAFAVSRKPDSGACTGTISDNDIKMDAVIAPAYAGRLNTSTALSSSQIISVRIKNLDDNITPGSISVGYILNNGSPVIETITPNILAGSTYIHNFSSPVDLSAIGTYSFKFFVNQGGDPYPSNDTLSRTIKQLDNALITGIDYPTYFIDNFDAAPEQLYNFRQVGLNGLDRYDFVNSDSLGRVRSFINTGIAYSGNRAITLDRTRYTGAVSTDSLTGTYNLSNYHVATDDIRLDFRYLNHYQLNYGANRVWVRGDDTKPWILIYDLYANQNPANGTYKFTSGIEVSDSLAAHSQDFSSSFQVRWGETGGYQATTNYSGGGYTFDDVRLYKVIDDIQMVSIDTPIVNSCGLSATTPVAVTIRNSSTATTGVIPVSYRINGGSWVTENAPLLAPNASEQYIFTTPANFGGSGNYLLEVKVAYPTDNYIENDTLSRTIINKPVNVVTNSLPYFQDFENSDGDWYTAGTKSTWEYGTPASYKISRAASGVKAWKTRLTGNYNDAEFSYLYSPCFDVSSVTNPTLSFSLALDLEDCGSGLCDGAYMEYSVDGKNWARLGAYGQGTNWYNKNYTNNNLWSKEGYQRWHVATIPLSVIPIATSQLTRLRFRFVMTSDPSVDKDGIAFDDFYIYDNPYGIYTGTSPSPSVNQSPVNGSNWIDFVSGGKLIASLNPNGSNLGSTDAQAFIYSGSVRVSSAQYYHNRNITIKPTTVTASDSVTVRFYFTDAETETLINATGCSSCSKPSMAYELGVTKYSDNDDSKENGTLADNSGGIFSFLNSSKVRIIPFDIGYYAEFKVLDFSEFWLNNGGIHNNTPLPVKLLNFTARKQSNNDVLLNWRTTEETDLSHFEVEVARSNEEYQLNRFATLGRVNSLGNGNSIQDYSFVDVENNKAGTRYYRLRMVDRDGQVKYSPIRPVLFNNDIQWQVYPNPSTGIFNLVYQLPDGETLKLKVYDADGRIVKDITTISSGFLQKQLIDCSDKKIAAGLYLLVAIHADKKQYFRLLKQ